MGFVRSERPILPTLPPARVLGGELLPVEVEVWRDGGNGPLRQRIIEMAHRHRRHGYRMIHLRLRHERWQVNLKRVIRLYGLEKLLV